MASPPSSGEYVPQSVALREEISTRLAQANLLRMRACWGPAIEECMDVLRLSPGNASAQSLLGDIYENQGRFDDAIQWFRMALDANPDSASDRAKLKHLLHVKERAAEETSRPSEDRVSAAAERRATTSAMPGETPALAERLGARFPERLIRWGAVGAGALTLVIILAAVLATAHHGLPTFPGAAGHEIKADPVLLPAPTSPPSSLPGPAAPAAPGRDPSEQTILLAVQASPALGAAGISPIDVQVDPRDSEVTLTLLCHGAVSRPNLLRAALLGAQAAAGTPNARAVSTLTIRCSTPSPDGSSDGSAPLAFMGDVAPASVPATVDVSHLTSDQIQGLFSNIWWSSQVSS